MTTLLIAGGCLLLLSGAALFVLAEVAWRRQQRLEKEWKRLLDDFGKREEERQ
jgi:hypothetical protein